METRTFENGSITHSQVTLVEAMRTNNRLHQVFLVTVQVLGRVFKVRYDIAKRIFIDSFSDPDIMYQLRRVELTVGERLDRLFA